PRRRAAVPGRDGDHRPRAQRQGVGDRWPVCRNEGTARRLLSDRCARSERRDSSRRQDSARARGERRGPSGPRARRVAQPVGCYLLAVTRNRWAIAAAAVVMQICLGAAYGWSVFVAPLVATTGWSLTEGSLTFTLAIAFLGAGTIVGGLWQDRVGPRRVATVAGVIYGISYL